MILQRDIRLRQEINEWGCYLMSIFFLVNKYTNRELSTELINELYHVFQKYNWMDEGCTIHDPNSIFAYLGLDVQYTDRHEPPGRKTQDNEIEILKFTSSHGDHFVVGDGNGNVAYDPWGISRAVRQGHIESKRIFRRL